VLDLSIEQTTKVILDAGKLSDTGRFNEAIKLIRDNIEQFHPVLRLEGIYKALAAARGLKNEALIIALEAELKKPTPDVASVRAVLSRKSDKRQ
jgi:hypothetical protein